MPGIKKMTHQLNKSFFDFLVPQSDSLDLFYARFSKRRLFELKTQL